MNFTWDAKKAESNLKKHKVSFAEAQTCFMDPLHVVIDDPDHSTDGDLRMILIGTSAMNKILVVVHIEYESDETIRIISARKATKNERARYQELP
jgi:uncharacterized DUF497 family protein